MALYLAQIVKWLGGEGEEMELWRSEEMQLVQLIIPTEAAHSTVSALGELGMLQFKDLNSEKSAFQRTYANQVKRCDEMARKLRFFRDMIESAGIVTAPASYAADKAIHMDELEVRMEELESELLEINGNTDKLTKRHAELVELQLVLDKAGAFFDRARVDASGVRSDAASSSRDPMEAPLLEAGAQGAEDGGKGSRLGFVAGVVAKDRLNTFERVLFRATRGNMFLRSVEIEGTLVDPSSGDKMEKCVFVVFFSGDRARTKILKICEAFNANRYPFPEERPRQRQLYAQVTASLKELSATLAAGTAHRDEVLAGVAASVESWIIKVKREKAVFHTLNKLSIDITHKALIAEAWCPAVAKGKVQAAVAQANDRSSASVGTIFQTIPTRDTPPTYFQTNKYTAAFQTIVDAYGIGGYREVNPAVFSLITFPFLFAVMFGDVGHGILLSMAAGYLVYNEKSMMGKKLNDMVEMMFGGRYMILMMGIFSIYTGALYNEFFAMPMTIFGKSHFKCPEEPEIDARGFEVCHQASSRGLILPRGANPYPFGVDPGWKGARTELSFLNSMKMKMSIIMGVVHMSLGIFHSLFNHLYFKDQLSITFEFIPQILFLMAMFGYLSLLIIVKWVSGSTADLYHVLIYMFLNPGNVDCGGECPENKIFAGQGGFQNFLLVIMLICVPTMLFPKPFILKKRHEEKQARLLQGGGYHALEEDHGHGGGHGHGHGDHFDFGEVMVHQMIHTIEFVLGAVSNTASYLRLWALSLAHSQLSAVFYERVLMLTFEMRKPTFIVIGFFVWLMATLGVLMVMETLSAFLHALRLHWVEFMNKFYRGDGYKFAPFAFVEVDQDEL